jgi:cytidylate kinase
VPAEGALVIDSTSLSIESVVEKILAFANEKLTQQAAV